MRNEFYLELVNNGVTKLLNFQDTRLNSLTEGCFFYPYWRLRKESFVNSRWQEAVLTLSWFYNKYNSEDIWTKIIKGIDFWCKLQHRNGAFPEYSRLDRSFSATAFSTLAMINSIILLNYSKEKWIEKITKSCEYLMKNDEFFLTSQEAAAALVLLKFGNYTNNIKYIKESERKIKLVLKNQNAKGYFKENNRFDFNHSTLTLELLGQYYLATDEKFILDSVSKFIDFTVNLDFRPLKNINWVVVSGFEISSDKTLNGNQALIKILNNFDVRHLESDKNYCTDLYRLCYAYDNFKTDLEHTDLEKNINTQKNNLIYRPSRFLNLIRPFGIHNFRKLKYLF